MGDREGEECAGSTHEPQGLRTRRLLVGGFGRLRERGEVVLHGEAGDEDGMGTTRPGGLNQSCEGWRGAPLRQ